MSDIKLYIKNLLIRRQIIIAENRANLFEEFVANENNCTAVQQIFDIQNKLMANWELKNRIADIQQQPVSIPNGTVGKPYEAIIAFAKLGWDDIAEYELEGLDGPELSFDKETNTITGVPTQSGDLKITFMFRLNDEPEDSPLNEKQIPLIINPNPKSLWKNIDSDRTGQFWKEDTIAAFDALGEKHIVVASKRGRSHATVGSFRDDDFAYKHYYKTGWSIVVVADGAGSAQ
ncbi:MAG: protein phosphatase 2C domain-containing protein, partial [Ferruginibacter sp.]